MSKYLSPTLLAAMVILSACGDYRLHLSKNATKPESVQLPPESEVAHTIYLIGDAGYSPENGTAAPLAALQHHLDKAPANSSVIFLGDNIYPSGLPPRKADDRAEAEHNLLTQLDILKNYKGQPYFIPGNHDWRYNLKGVLRQEEFVEEYLNKGNVWLPNNGCGDPEVVEVNDQLVIVFIDTHWWVTNWEKEPEINAGCEVKSRKNFLYLFEEAIKKHRDKNIVIAMHHPLYSNGPHGGRYTVKQHLFPLTDLSKNLYLPLPVVGSVFAFLRGTIGSRQDVANPQTKALKKGLLASAQKNGSFTFVCGHEHNLQYFENDNQAYIVSGAGAKTSPASLGRGAQFAYGRQGFSILKYYKDGSSWVQFWVSSDTQPEGELVFQKQVKGPLPKPADVTPAAISPALTETGIHPIAIDTSPAKGAFHRFIWGEHYRNVYRTPIDAPVLNLDEANGGLQPLKRGGGYQTNSLRLEDPEGKQYVIRAVVKDATRIVPYPFNKTFAKDIFSDQFSAAHPFSALAVPIMAQAAGIYYTNPQVYYVPKQPGLGQYNDGFGNELYLFEERPDKEWRGAAQFGSPDDITDTPDVIKKRSKNAKHRIDAAFVVRNRLFDQLIGDWDRHDDQWRWAAFEDKENNVTRYRPIPRDRDQAFHKYDGLITGLLRNSLPFLRQLRVFDPKVKNIKWVTYNARLFDQTFLTEADWPVWEQEARRLQAQVTDEVIEKSIALMPASAFQLTGAELIGKVKGRRDNLLNIARKQYQLLARKVDIVGTDKKDYFEVIRLNDDSTLVSVYELKKGKEKGVKYYERVFLSADTREIRLYGLDDEDLFLIMGKVQKGILVRAIGGLEEDLFIDESAVAGPARKTQIYDNRDKNKFETGSETRRLISNDPVMNGYDRKAPDYEYDHLIPFPAFGFNPDDGGLLGVGFRYLHYGFKRSPYSAIHQARLQYAFATSGYSLAYKGEFVRAIRKTDFLLEGRLQGPLFTLNYFGLGNETELLPDTDLDYNRIRQELYGIYPALRRPLGHSANLTWSFSAEAVDIQRTPGRFITSGQSGVPDDVFTTNYYGGSALTFNYANVDQPNFPTLGFAFNAGAGLTTDIERISRRFSTFSGSLSVYLGSEKIVLATRIGGKHVDGDFAFFQGATLGGSDNLRGFREERFTGRTAFYHNTDLRIRLLNVDNYYLPFTLGIYGGYDYGRVWLEEQKSRRWHQGYGGGLWLSPFDALVINLSLFRSDDGNRFMVSGGFLF
ncbi:MAG: metallophosphoesterase [Saprospiraceae bacterium]|nr:metallophosphoesterase [Saprospiraceae bacterium]